MESSFEKVLLGTIALHELYRQGKDEGSEADAIRDSLDGPWRSITASERVTATAVSAALQRQNAQDQQPRTREAASDGSVCEPVAWVAFATDASESRAVCLTRQEAETVSRKHGWGVAPLYAVRLTDEEVLFLRRERDLMDADDEGDRKALEIVDGLLGRLGGWR